MNEDFFNLINQLKDKRKDFIIITMVHARGSAPQEIGAKIIVGENGLLYGTVGGGKVEEKAISLAKSLLKREEKHDFVEWNLQTDVGMTCGGLVSLYFEKITSESSWKIAIFGAGHVAQELIGLLIKLDCDITWIDPRLEWLDKLPNHSRLHKICTEDMKGILATLDSATFIASMTMGHAFDLPILIEALTHFNFPYIGVIGSDSKACVLKNDLRKNGVDEKNIATLNCPIGESFGNNQPVEIALSIVAQLLIKRDALQKIN
jgi:xanthine dehydrogenase accessory factor